MEQDENLVIESNDDLEFESGFDDSIETDTPSTVETAPSESVAESEIKAEIEQEAQIQQAIEDNPALSESQIRELFEHNNSKIYGKFGEVQREVNRLKELAEQMSTRSVQQSQGSPIEVTADMFSNMREEFGEDFAAALARDLAKIPLGAGSQQAISQEQIDLILSQKVEQLKNDFEVKYVARQHPDWEEIAHSDDFNGWKAQLPADVQDRLSNSWDSDFITAALSAYKKDRDDHKRALDEAAKKQQHQDVVKQKKLQAAVMPQSSGGSSDNYDDDFEAGFNSDL